MDVVITGAYGRVGTALLDHTSGEFEYVPFDRREHPDLDTIVGDVTNFDAVRSALEHGEAVVHLAADPAVEADWGSVLENNIVGTYNCLEACRQCEVETAVLSSSNHVVGMYECDHAPDLYETDYELLLDHRSPIRPDSLYGVSKAFLEALGRYYVEHYEYPSQVYALRIGSVRYPAYDHPYGDAERGVEAGRWTRGSDEYQREVKRMKATWHSRRDLAALVERCLEDDTATFEIFYGVSDNERRWFDIYRPRRVVGYSPRDNGEEWDQPPDPQPTHDTVAFDSTD
jgi:nucleoside-diphosphate-sugar epimerase